MDGKKGVGIAITILVVGIIVANVLPLAIGELNTDTKSATITQNEEQNYNVVENVYSNATDINKTGEEITFVINDTDTAGSKTVTISNQTTQTITMDDGDINVTVDSIADTTTATVTYGYPKEYGWSSGQKSLFGILPLFFVIAVVLWVVRYAMKTGG
ncbi:hypothetical protein [Methanohalobium sp.]|uniref:hypothetical protein n=1 Tax=Methanohalobium sp. TaxID=2837493 RepID=UPI0025DCA168|nr:hypothetical protein [Methanohalobium sp.]